MGYREINELWLLAEQCFADSPSPSKASARPEKEEGFIMQSIEMHRYAQIKGKYLVVHNYALEKGEQLLDSRIIVPDFQISC